MRTINFPILGPANPSKAKEFGRREFENMYLVSNSYAVEEGGQVAAYSRKGLKEWKDLVGSQVRGGYVQDNLAYVCMGNTVYTVDTDKTASSIGTIGTTSGKVYINGTETNIVISDGSAVYNYNIADAAFTTLTLPSNFSSGSPTMTTSDGYVLIHTGARFYLSSLVDTTDTSEVPDFTTSPAFANAQGKPDDLVAITAFQRNIVLCGDISTEVWFNSGAADFTYSRISGVFINYGCQAKDSLALGDVGAFWLAKGEQGQLCVLSIDESFSELIISSSALNSELLGYTKTSDAEGFVYQREGKEFYVLTFPTENVTWVYDIQLQVWMKYSTGEDKWRARFHIGFAGKNLFGSYDSGVIYEMDENTFSDNGDVIKRKILTAPIVASNKLKYLKELYVDIENGDALVAGQGNDPQLQMRYSRDGGHTFTNTIYRDMGKLGDYLKEIKYVNINITRKMVFEFTYAEPTDFKVIGAWLTYQNEMN